MKIFKIEIYLFLLNVLNIIKDSTEQEESSKIKLILFVVINNKESFFEWIKSKHNKIFLNL